MAAYWLWVLFEGGACTMAALRLLMLSEQDEAALTNQPGCCLPVFCIVWTTFSCLAESSVIFSPLANWSAPWNERDLMCCEVIDGSRPALCLSFDFCFCCGRGFLFTMCEGTLVRQEGL